MRVVGSIHDSCITKLTDAVVLIFRGLYLRGWWLIPTRFCISPPGCYFNSHSNCSDAECLLLIALTMIDIFSGFIEWVEC